MTSLKERGCNRDQNGGSNRFPYIQAHKLQSAGGLWSPTGWWLQPTLATWAHFSVWRSCAALAHCLKHFKLSSFLGEPWVASFILPCPQFCSKPVAAHFLTTKKKTPPLENCSRERAATSFRSWEVARAKHNWQTLQCCKCMDLCGVQTVGQDPQKESHDSQRILLHRNVLFLLCFILIIYNIFLTESWLQPRKSSKKIFKLNNLRGAVNAKFNTKQQVKVAVFVERIIYNFYRFTCCLKKLDSGPLLRFYNLM